MAVDEPVVRGQETNDLDGAHEENTAIIHTPLPPSQMVPVTKKTTTNSTTPSIWKRIIFQRLLILSISRLTIYLSKLFGDCTAVDEYYSDRDWKFCLVSIASLIAPPAIYAVYRIGTTLAKDDVISVTEVSTQTVNGFLLIPWQIKHHLDVLHYSAQRVCEWRKPKEAEQTEMKTMERKAEVLEFFEDFYAGFLQILLQLYIFFGTLNWVDTHQLKTTPLIWVLVSSSFSVLSMMIAVRRRDDGPLTGFLSFLGWLSLILSRILVFSLVSTYIHSGIFVLCLIHVLAFSIWIYNMAMESYQITDSDAANANWTTRKRASIAILVFLFFGIPSLLIWPIMFQLKEGRRPLIFLLVITIENLGLLALWFICHLAFEAAQLKDGQIILVSAVVIFTLTGVLFLMVYVFIKPKLTDQVMLNEIREHRNSDVPTLKANNRANTATTYGIYYEFCDIVFRLPTTNRIAEDLQTIRQMGIE